MSKAQNKTTMTGKSVEAFIAAISDEEKRNDSQTLLALFQEVTGKSPQMWGSSIVGFGQYHYVYASGREGDAIAIGFSPRKAALTLYLAYGLENHKELLDKLGPHSLGKACLYIKRLQDVDIAILRQLVTVAYTETAQNQTIL